MWVMTVSQLYDDSHRENVLQVSLMPCKLHLRDPTFLAPLASVDCLKNIFFQLRSF